MFMRFYFWHYFNVSHKQTLSPIYVAVIWWEYIFYASMPHSISSWGEFWKRMCNDEKNDQLRCMWLVSIFFLLLQVFFNFVASSFDSFFYRCRYSRYFFLLTLNIHFHAMHWRWKFFLGNVELKTRVSK